MKTFAQWLETHHCDDPYPKEKKATKVKDGPIVKNPHLTQHTKNTQIQVKEDEVRWGKAGEWVMFKQH